MNTRVQQHLQNKGTSFDGEKFIIHDISRCDDSLLDFDYPLLVKNTGQQNEVSCRNIRIMLAWLANNTNLDVEHFIERRYRRHSFAFLDNPRNWISFEDMIEFFKCVKQELNVNNPRFFLDMGKYSARYQSLGAGLNALAMLVNLRRAYWLAPKYNRNFNTVEFLQSKQLRGTTYVVTNTFSEHVRPQTILDQDYWTLGVMLGLPDARGLPFARGTIDYTFFSIEEVLDRDYAWLNINYRLLAEKTGPGIEKRVLFIGEREHGHDVLILKESMGREVRRLGRAPIMQEHTSYRPAPHEFSEFSPAEIHELLSKKKAARVMLITRPLVIDNQLVFNEGELYGAPYSRFTIRFQDRSRLATLWGSIRSARSTYTMSRAALEEEIRIAREEALRANRETEMARASQRAVTLEKAESERRLRISEVYTRKSLVEIIRGGDDPTTHTPEARDLTVLFNDIRGFTSLAEQMTPTQVVEFLNNYFNRMNEHILRNEGEIDKLIGDCIMAAFERPESAVQAAIGMRNRLNEYNEERRAKNLRPVNNGIGIACGPVIVGNIGSSEKLDFTIIGDVVNTASRLEALTSYYGAGIIVSDLVRENISDYHEARFIDIVLPKGKNEPIRIYEILDHLPENIREMYHNQEKQRAEAFDYYRHGNFREAHKMYTRMISEITPKDKECPDPLLVFYRQRCESISRRMKAGVLPRKGWRGIYEFN